LTDRGRGLKRKLGVRERVPHFRRQETWKYRRLGESWRRPKGLDNKMRQERKGWPSRPKVGYGVPKEIRGLHPSGLKPAMIQNLNDLDDLEEKEDVIVVISSRIGNRKKKLITDKARNMGLRIANPFKEEVFE